VYAFVPKPVFVVPAAKAWIKANPDAATQPWDKKGFRYPGGDATSPKVRQIAQMSSAMLVAKTRGLMPAPERILDIAVNSMRMGFDSALCNESRGICALITTPECKAAITTFFFGMQAIKSGKTRPEGPKWRASKAGVLGAGMMGAGIAWANASRGLATVLKDTDQAKADHGKSYSQTLADKAIKRGSMYEAGKEALLNHITAIADNAALP